MSDSAPGQFREASATLVSVARWATSAKIMRPPECRA
jgi:hypothetical protein